jgi:hypothetical protein
MTAGCSMNAMVRMALPQRGQTRGSTSYTCLMSRAQARFAVEAANSLNAAMFVGSSLSPFRRLPRLTLLYQP